MANHYTQRLSAWVKDSWNRARRHGWLTALLWWINCPVQIPWFCLFLHQKLLSGTVWLLTPVISLLLGCVGVTPGNGCESAFCKVYSDVHSWGQNTDESRVVRKMALAKEPDTKEMRELGRFLREHCSRQREQQSNRSEARLYWSVLERERAVRGELSDQGGEQWGSEGWWGRVWGLTSHCRDFGFYSGSGRSHWRDLNRRGAGSNSALAVLLA